ncbi:dockerin type I domain-containing protein [Planctomycetota bacterium]
MRRTPIRPTRHRRAFQGIEQLEQRRVLATLAGHVVEDLNGNGSADEGEPEIAGVHVYDDANGNGVLDRNGSFVEPDDFSEHSATSVSNITMTVADSNNTPIGEDVRAKSDNLASTGGNVFGYGDGVGTSVNFFHHFRRLRADFTDPVSTVSIDFVARDGETGTMEAYDQNGNLVNTATTEVLEAGELETMRVDGGMISYVVAYNAGESGLRGRLDNLRVDDLGSELWTVTGPDGNYSMDVDAGTYHVDVVLDGMEKTFPTGASTQTVSQDDVISGIDFGLRTSVPTWHNVDDPLDVDASGSIVPLDVLLIINEINQPAHADPTTGSLPAAPNNLPDQSSRAYFFDVNDDGFVTAGDAVRIINFLNAQARTAAAAVPAASPRVSSLASSEIHAAIVDQLANDDSELFGPRPHLRDSVSDSLNTVMKADRPIDLV